MLYTDKEIWGQCEFIAGMICIAMHLYIYTHVGVLKKSKRGRRDVVAVNGVLGRWEGHNGN